MQSKQAYHSSIRDNCKALGLEYNLDYNTFLAACNGFVKNIAWNLELCFSCSNCGTSPTYFVGDGKCDIAPLQRKLKPLGITEMSTHPQDKKILSQATNHSDRIYLNQKKFMKHNISIMLFGGQSVFLCTVFFEWEIPHINHDILSI